MAAPYAVTPMLAGVSAEAEADEEAERRVKSGETISAHAGFQLGIHESELKVNRRQREAEALVKAATVYHRWRDGAVVVIEAMGVAKRGIRAAKQAISHIVASVSLPGDLRVTNAYK